MWKIQDFKEAKYNPRYISDSKLKKLQKSIESLGDLSGIVFNKRTSRLVSGHQRLKTLAGKKTKVVTERYLDKHGTVEKGHIEAWTEKGVIQIPLRIVDWSDEKVEKAANIAANAHGGEFDKEKLRKVLQSLDTKTFDIELLGLDPLTIKSLSIPTPKASLKDMDGESGEEFQKFDESSFDLKCTCPRCGFKFDPKVKAKKDQSVKKEASSKKEQHAKKKVSKPTSKVAVKAKKKSNVNG